MHVASFQAVLLSSIVLGSLYALMATGLSMVWGTMRIFNFAHGCFMMLGAYAAWVAGNRLGTLVGMVAGFIIVGSLGGFLERTLIRPFVVKSSGYIVTSMVITSISLFLQNSVQIIWGPRMKQLPLLVRGDVPVLGTRISAQEMVIAIVAPSLLVLLSLFLKKSRMGLAIRSVEQNRSAARLVGVNNSIVYIITFGMAAALAAMAGILLGSIRFITPSMGDSPLTKAFIIVILGGLGNLNGTMAAAYLIGLLEAVCTYFLGLYWTPLVLFLVMIVVLVFRPTGLLGEA